MMHRSKKLLGSKNTSMRNVRSTCESMAQHTPPSSSRARGMLTDTSHHRASVQAVGKPYLNGLWKRSSSFVRRREAQWNFRLPTRFLGPEDHSYANSRQSISVVRGVGILTASDPSGRLQDYQMSPGLHVRGDNVGKPEVNRGALVFGGGLGILRGFCYTL
jgi:hypothetical protein